MNILLVSPSKKISYWQMRNPVIILANDTHSDIPVVSLIFEKDYALFGRVEICAHIANTALAKIKNPLDRFLENNGNDINMLQK